MPAESALDTGIGGQLHSRGVDCAIGQLADRQHGVVARQQLSGMGIGNRAIDHRLLLGRLRRIHRGVYAVGHRALRVEGSWMAAVLAGGPRAVLSHRSAAALWGLRSRQEAATEVTSPSHCRPRQALAFHRRRLPPDEITAEQGIPVTTVPRTLFDLASVLTPRQVERAITEAEVRRLYDAVSLHDLVERYRGCRGTGVIRAILSAQRIGAEVTRSELEERFLAFIEWYGLPRPEINVGLAVRGTWLQVDCLWRSSALIVELDGSAAHATANAFERDRARDRALAAAGWQTIRITWRHLHDEPEAVAADLRRLLDRNAP
jgi:Protein of unknown function (DUF559)